MHDQADARIPRKQRRSCDFCTESKLKCSQEKPACRRCIKRGQQECSYSQSRRPGRPPRSPGSSSSIPGTKSSANTHHPPTAGHSTDEATITINIPHADQLSSGDGGGVEVGDGDREVTDGGRVSSWPVDHSAGAVMTTSTTVDFEQVFSGVVDGGYFDSIFSQDWSQLGADDSTDVGLNSVMRTYNLGTYTSDQSAMLLGSLESPLSTNRVSVGDESPKGHSGSFDSSRTQREELSIREEILGQRGESISSSSAGRCISTETALASLLYTSFQEGSGKANDGSRCECPRLLGQLVQFTNQWSTLSRSADLDLDILLAMEQVTFSTNQAISKCTDCDLSSPYVAIIICATMDWILENLGNHLRDGSLLDEITGVQYAGTRREVRPGSYPDQDLVWDSSTTSSPHLLYIGQLPIPAEVSRACIVELLKLRLRRLVRAVKDIVLISRKNKKTLSNVVRCAAKDVRQKAEAMFGMIDL